METTQRFVKPKEKIAFALSSINSYMIVAFSSTYLIFFYTDILIVPVAFVNILMWCARVWDAVNDPLMGMVIDRTSTPMGKMRPYLKWGAIPMGISIILCFTPIGGSMTFKMIYAATTYVAFGMLYTLTDIPLWGAVAIASPNGNERAGLLSFCVTIGSVGSLIPMAVLPLLTEWLSGWGYFAFACIAGVFCIFTLINISRRAKERIDSPKDMTSLGAKLKMAMKNRPLVTTMLASILSCTRYLMQLAAIYVSTYVLKIGNLSPSTVLLVIYAVVGVGMFVGMLLTPLLYKRLGYRTVFIGSGAVGTVFLIIAFLVGYENYLLSLPLVAIGGITLGTYLVLPYPMVGDSLDYLEWKTGKRMEGFCFSLNSFVSKFNQAFAAIAVTTTLLLINFKQPVQSNVPLPQEESTLLGLYALVTLLPAVGFGLSMIPMFFYDFQGKKRDMIMTELSARRQAAALLAERRARGCAKPYVSPINVNDNHEI